MLLRIQLWTRDADAMTQYEQLPTVHAALCAAAAAPVDLVYLEPGDFERLAPRFGELLSGLS